MPKPRLCIVHIISSFYHTLRNLHAISDFCISHKKTRKAYVYKQGSTRNSLKRSKIKVAEEAHYLSLYERHQKVKARRKEL